MFRLRTAAVLAAVLGTAVSGLSASPAAAADQLAACDATTAPGLQWTAPSFLAWGRQARIGADVSDPADGPAYEDGSAAVTVDAGGVSAASDPVDHDLEFVLKAPAHGAVANAAATWSMADDTAAVRCAQTASLSVPLGAGKTLAFRTKPQADGVAWVPVAAGDCHDIALEPISLTVVQGSVTRKLSAADQCDPAGHGRVATADWELVLANGQFQLHALKPHSSIKERMRFALRVGSRRVATGSLSLVRTYRPVRLIIVSDPSFQSVCVGGPYPPKWYGSTVGCKIPGAFSVHLAVL